MLVGGSPVPGNIVKMQSPRDIFLGTVIVLKLKRDREEELARDTERLLRLLEFRTRSPGHDSQKSCR